MAVKIFCCYAREDQHLLFELRKHLKPLQLQGLITIWADTDINAGEEWEREINDHLDRADIILLLISPDFIASDYCYSKEMKRAIEMHNQGEARVIPVILRPTHFKNAPFGKLQALPKDARSIVDWPNMDSAFFNVTIGIEESIDTWLGLNYYPETVAQAIKECYLGLDDGAIGLLGKPIPISLKDTIQITSGRDTIGYKRPFTKGAIYWSERGGAHPIFGAIGYLYHQHADIASRLGFPLTNEIPAADSPQHTKGLYQRFEGTWDYPESISTVPVERCGATVYWSLKYGEYETWGGIGEYYESQGGTSSFLGFPTSSEMEAATSAYGTDGYYQRFEGGLVFWCEKYGSVPVVEPVLTVYDRFKGTSGKFGFPKSPEVLDLDHSSIRIQEFEGGVICISS